MATAEFDNELMRKARKALGITQTELATLVGIKQGTLSMYENGKANPSLTVRIALATVLGEDGLIVKRVPVSV